MGIDLVQYTVEDKIAWITLNRPEKLNAISKLMWKTIERLVDDADGDARVVITAITGMGRAFCSGDDISDLYSLKNRKEAENLIINTMGKTIKRILSLSKPIVAAVNGLAYGGGAEILFLCDYVIAVKEATFALPEGRIGALPPISASLAPISIGLKRTNQLLYTGEAISASQALEYGLVNEVVENKKLRDAVKEFSYRVSALSPSARTATKRLLMQQIDLGLLDKSMQQLVEITQTDDFREGVTAFLEKRKPKYDHIGE